MVISNQVAGNGRNAEVILISKYEINRFFSYSHLNGFHSILLRALTFTTTMRWAFIFFSYVHQGFSSKVQSMCNESKIASIMS